MDPYLAVSALDGGRHGEFVDQALQAIRDLPDSPKSTHLIRVLMGDPHTFERLTDPGFLTGLDAIRIAARMQEIDPSLDVRLLRQLQRGDGFADGDSWRASRVLEIVAAISDGKRIVTRLPALLRHPDARVRSKVALLLGNCNRNLRWLGERLLDADSRIRANAVQAAWGVDSREARDLFIAATRDADYRVVANGAVGLHRSGDLLSAWIIQDMAARTDSKSHCSAIWAMGETQDPRFVPALERILKEAKGSERRNALRAIVRIRARVTGLARLEPLRVGAVRSSREIEVRVRSAAAVEIADLRDTSFVINCGADIIEINSIDCDCGSYRLLIENLPKQDLTVAVYAECGMGQALCRY
jgi:hypothetical protein